MNPPDALSIVFVGAGAIGGTVAGWVAAHHPPTYLLAREPAAGVIRTQGLQLYSPEAPGGETRVPVQVIGDLAEAPNPDVVVLAVKLYDLENAARMVTEKLGDPPLVLGLQNGIANQEILPRYFSRVVYGVVSYNAWVEQPGRFGFQDHGPLVIGTPDNSLQGEMNTLAAVFNQGVPTVITQRLVDAVHCKLAINLSNSVTTLLGSDLQRISNLDFYQDILANTIYEGVRVIRAAGYHEERHGRLPSWFRVWASAKLPHFITRGIFLRSFQRLHISSMGQDVLLRKKSVSELEYLNGYLLELAARHHVDVPYSRAIYRLCKQHFGEPDFQPLDVKNVWQEIAKES